MAPKVNSTSAGLPNWNFCFTPPWENEYLPYKDLFGNIQKEPSPKLKEHIESVVNAMYKLLFENKNFILQQVKDHKEFKHLEEILNNLNDRERKILLYTALYHDIGKGVIQPRHGPEGGDIIKDSSSYEREKFYELGFKSHNEIFLMSDLIRFHDFFGTLKTGESSYIIFVEVLYPVTNYSLTIKDYENKFLDYLLLINIADIVGSGSSGIVDKEMFPIIMHDFQEIKNVHEGIIRNLTQHSDALSGIFSRRVDDIIPGLKRIAENHTHERLRRLLREGFNTMKPIKIEEKEMNKEEFLKKYEEGIEEEFRKEKERYRDPTFKVEDWFFRDYETINDVEAIIVSLRGINVEREFYTKFAFICKLDYALGFVRDFLTELIKSEIEKIQKGKLKSLHDLRRDLSMSLVELIDTLVKLYGDFTSNDTRIGIGLERLSLMYSPEREKLIKRLTGQEGPFKKAEAYTKLRNAANLWIIKP